MATQLLQTMRFLFTILVLLSFTGVSAQSAGNFDPTFGTNGVLVRDLYGYTDGIQAIETLSDGKILAAGFGFDGTRNHLSLTRYYPDGSIDLTFNQNILTQGLPSTSSIVAEDLFETTDGDLFITASVQNGSQSNLVIISINSLGFKETSFGTNGIVVLGEAGYTYNNSCISILPNGNIMIAATADNSLEKRIAMWSILSDGTTNRSFGSDGMMFNAMSGADLSLANLHFVSNNNIILSGSLTSASVSSGFVVSYSSDGTVNSSFGNGGYYNFGSAQEEASFNDTYTDSYGNIFITGYVDQASIRKVLLIKLENTGTPDYSFGNGGIQMIEAGVGFASGEVILAGMDGHIMIGANCFNGQDNDMLVACVDESGQLDNSFSFGGLKQVSIFNGHDMLRAMSISREGRILIAGNTDNGNDYDMAIVSLNGFSSVTGISDNANANSLSVNILPGRIQLDAVSDGNLLLIDMSGRVISNQKVYRGSNEIAINESGVYVLHLITDLEKYSVKLMVP